MHETIQSSINIGCVFLPAIHFNGGTIPLTDSLPIKSILFVPKTLKWVFAMQFNNTMDLNYVQILKVDVLKEITLLVPVCIAMITSSSSARARNILKWLADHNVIIVRHKPSWDKKMKYLIKSGKCKQNKKYSPIYKSFAALITKFLRFDIPIFGFIDDYILYADVDIMFLKNIELEDFGKLPKYYLIDNRTDD